MNDSSDIQDSEADATIPFRLQESFRMSGEMAPLFTAKAKARAGYHPIVKDKSVKVTNKEGKYLYSFVYADLGSVIAATEQALAENGLDLMWFLSDAPDGKTLRCILAHASGAFIESCITIPPGESPQELGSALTYARRYQAQCVLGVAPEEDDDGSAAGGKVAIPQEPSQKPQRTPPSPAPKAEPKAPPAVAQAPATEVKRPGQPPMNPAMAQFAQEQAQSQAGEVLPETITAIRSLCVQLQIGATKANVLCDEVVGKPRKDFTQADAEKFLHHLQEMQLSAKGAA